MVYLALVLLAPTCAWAGFAEVGGGSQRVTKLNGSGTTIDIVYPGNVSANSLLLIGCSFWSNPAATVTGATDTVSTSYAAAITGTLADGLSRVHLIYGKAPSSGANTVTVTFSQSGSGSCSADEFIGQHATPLDAAGTVSTGTSTAPSASVTSTVANDLIVGVMTQSGNASPTITPDAGWTQIGEEEVGTTDMPHSLIFKIVTTAQPYTPSWTLGASEPWGAIAAAFKPAVAGAVGTRLPLTGAGK